MSTWTEMPSWGFTALAVQLTLALLAPAIPLGGRSLFLGDLWCFLWVTAALVRLVRSKDLPSIAPLLKRLALTALVFLIVFLHGYWRPSLVAPLDKVGLNDLANDLFNPARESVVAARFVSWIWAAQIVAYWFSCAGATYEQGRSVVRRLRLALAINLIVCGGVMILTRLSPSASSAMEQIYGYKIIRWWKGREYGVFRSPIEAAALFGLGIPLLCAGISEWTSKLGIALGMIGIYLSRTLTPIIGWGLAGLIFLASKLSRIWRIAFLAGAAVAVPIIYKSMEHSQHPEVYQKFSDFIYRYGPWKIYWETALNRWDYFVFGLGFPEYHADNSYVFLFNRGGLLLLGYVLTLIFLMIQKNWPRWNWAQKSSVLYILFSGLALDIFIMRHVALTWIAVGVATLTLSTRTSSENKSL